MALFDDILKGGPLPFLGFGIVALAVPYFVPALRPQFAAILKSGARLFVEAELGADDAIVDRYVDAAIDALLQTAAQGTEEERKEKAEAQVNRFVARAQAGARRRGWDEQDIERRYRRRLAKLEHALQRAQHHRQARPRQHTALVTRATSFQAETSGHHAAEIASAIRSHGQSAGRWTGVRKLELMATQPDDCRVLKPCNKALLQITSTLTISSGRIKVFHVRGPTKCSAVAQRELRDCIRLRIGLPFVSEQLSNSGYPCPAVERQAGRPERLNFLKLNARFRRSDA